MLPSLLPWAGAPDEGGRSHRCRVVPMSAIQCHGVPQAGTQVPQVGTDSGSLLRAGLIRVVVPTIRVSATKPKGKHNDHQRSPYPQVHPKPLSVGSGHCIGRSVGSRHICAADATTVANETPASDDPAVTMYAADYSVSAEEATRRLDRIQPLHELMAAIREAEAARVAGWGIDHSPTFTGWVLLTGTEAPTTVSAATVEANTDLEIRTGAAHTYTELLRAKQALHEIGPVGRVDDLGDNLAGTLDMISFTAVDMAANAVEIGNRPTTQQRQRAPDRRCRPARNRRRHIRHPSRSIRSSHRPTHHRRPHRRRRTRTHQPHSVPRWSGHDDVYGRLCR